MFGLEMLDVVIGIIFVYLLLSLICTAVNEFIEAKLKLRAVDLEQGIRELLNDQDATGLVPKIFDHQLIYCLFRGSYNPAEIRNVGKNVDVKMKRYSRGSDLPSYIPARNFALALMDVLLPASSAAAVTTAPVATPLNLSGSSGSLAPHNNNLPQTPNTPLNPNPLAALRNAADNMTNTRVKNALVTIIDAAGDDPIKAREGIENWYNSSMDRVSGRYKRRVQEIVFIMGFLVAFIMNADTFAIFNNLANDRPLRASIVSAAQSIKENKPSDSSKIKNDVDELLQLGLPIGWSWKSSLNPNARTSNLTAIPEFNTDNFGHSIWIWVLKFFGWLVTGLAISLGAPFWFDILNKIMVIRSTVKPEEKSHAESSKD